MKRVLALLTAILLFVVGTQCAQASTKTYLIDFGRSTFQMGTTGWNNMTDMRNGSSLSLIDSTGVSSLLTLSITDSFYYDSGNTVDFSTNINGTTSSSVYPSNATHDSFFLGTLNAITDNSATIVISGLSDTNTYDFKFYASRTSVADTRRAQYTIGATTVSLDASNNVDNTVSILGVVPTSGSITITIAKNPSDTLAYLGVLEITQNSTNSVPVVNAGTDQIVTLPTTFTTLSGSATDSDGTILSYVWSLVSGPVAPTIVSASSASTSITDMTDTGPYVFKLTATDNNGGVGEDTMTVTVQNSLPQSKFNVSEASRPVTGWTNVAGNPANSTPTATDSVTGFGFRSTGSANWNSTFGSDNSQDAFGETVDDGGGFAFPAGVVANLWYNYNDVFTTNKYQTQLFGLDSNKRYTVVILGSRGTANSATAPRVTDYNLKGATVLPVQTLDSWRNTSHTVTFSSVKPDASGFINVAINKKADGTGGSFGYLNGITVTEDANTAPTANAGIDQSITLPTTSTTLSGSGSDTDGTIASYAWSFVSGPTTPSITSASSASTNVTGLSSAGTYQFRLTVTDNNGATGTDDINVTVNEASNQTPTANAGSDQVIYLPTTTATLSGSGSDTDGTIASYAWSFVSGPTTPSITSASSASTNVTGLSSAGTYVFRLTVTDNNGATGTDDINVVVNTAPTANAGIDQTISLPTSSVTLSGSGSDSDGTIASYAWSFTSGPATPTITSASSASTNVSGLSSAGTYVFQLTVTDNRGATGTDTISVVVNSGNQSPIANAGIDQSITMPTNSVTLSGSGTDSDGTIASYAWTETTSGYATINSSASASTTVTDLAAGTYTFRLTVTDNNGATGTDDITVTVGSQSFGTSPAKTIVILGSSTAAGYNVTPISDSWANRFETYFNALKTGNDVVNLAVSGYTTYQIMPTGSTPPGGRPSPDTAHNITEALTYDPDAIIINMPSNDSVANYTASEQESNYQTIVALANSAGVPVWIATTQPRNSLNASQMTTQTTVRDWILSTYGTHAIDFWTTIANANGTINATYNSGDGIHLNNIGHKKLYARVAATNLITTITANANPTANAGSDQVIHLPTTTATLSGSGSDTDGTIASYAWSFVSGPTTPSITSASSASTGVTGLSSAGTYVFQLTVTDDRGGTGTDTISVVINTPPTASAGSDQVITLPTSTATLSGSGSDTDGSIASYAWSIVSGPSTPSITSTGSASTGVTGLSSAGMYVFRLTVTDNNGATGTDDVSVVVNTAPTANAGNDQSIALPTTAATLSGSGSDTDGTIASYAWSFISGPATPTITSASSASTNVSGLSLAGTYVFRLTVTDNNGATGTDDIVVVVNTAPTANAGSDQSITLPTSTATLSGSGSDTDGTIASYTWTFVTGPSTPSITSASSASTGITNLTDAGTYTFRLTVTDNRNATGFDDVSIIVNSPANQSPVADAGSDQSITLPTSSATLSGSGSDSDGSIASYEWIQLTGPETATIVDEGSASTSVTGLSSAGTYTFRFTVTDDEGATATDDVAVVVSEAPSGGGGGGGGSSSGGSSGGRTATTPTTPTIPTLVPLTPAPTTTIKVKTTARILNVRAAPNGEIIAKLPYGTEVTVNTNTSIIPGWLNVVMPDNTAGWISAAYTIPITDQPSVPQTTNTTATTTAMNLNVRNAPAGGIIRTVPLGTTITVLTTSGTWSQVQLADGETGWVSTRYIRSTQAVPTAPATSIAPTVSQIPAGTTIVVIARLLNVRVSAAGVLKGQVTTGATGIVTASAGDWSQVIFDTGINGWVSTVYIREQTPPTT